MKIKRWFRARAGHDKQVHSQAVEASSTRVWMVSNLPPPVHGVSVFNSWLLPALQERGFAVSFIWVGSRGTASQLGMFGARKLIRDGTAVLSFLTATLWNKSTSRAKNVLYFTPSQSGPGVFRDVILTRLGALVADRIVAHIHGCGWLAREGRNGLVSRVMRGALANSDVVICLGETFAARMREATGFNCVGIDNGTPQPVSVATKRLPDSGGKVFALFLSNFIPSKGLIVAAQAVRLLRKEGRDIVLRCAGSWRRLEDEQEFKVAFDKELASGAIELVGPADQTLKVRLLHEAHFFLLPTRYPLEGQPLALIEALSHGVVPLTTDQGGIPDLMNFPGGDGLFGSDFDRPEPIVRTIARLMDDASEYYALSRSCIAHHRSCLTFDRCVEEIAWALQAGRSKQSRVDRTMRRHTGDERTEESPAEIGAK